MHDEKTGPVNGRDRGRLVRSLLFSFTEDRVFIENFGCAFYVLVAPVFATRNAS